jgi:predicted nucleic-acid-binding Zn-ribbon protein
MTEFSEQQRAAETAEEELLGHTSTWRCVKCAHHEAEIGQSRQTGGFFPAAFDVETLRFTRVTCCRCGYTEFYRKPMSLLAELFDLSIT